MARQELISSDYIYYSAGFKYQLRRTYKCRVKIYPERYIVTEFINLSPLGILTIRSGYAWDGPSGPTIDTPSFMRGSLVHDALYQLMRMELLDRKWRQSAKRQVRQPTPETPGKSLRPRKRKGDVYDTGGPHSISSLARIVSGSAAGRLWSTAGKGSGKL